MLPLEGVKVIEFANNLAGPFGSQILANLGADVVKIERPEGGDDCRYWGEKLTPDAGPTFHAMNYNKRGIAVDLTDPAEIAWLKDYIAGCDVLLQNMRPGAMEELGLDAATLRAINPKLIYCSVSAFGSKGPLKMRPGYEPVVQAFAGLFSANGVPEGPFTRVGVPILDLGSGMWAAIGCIAALFQRQTTGKGCTVDASLFEAAMGWLQLAIAAYLIHGTLPVRHRTGSSRIVVFGSVPTSDGEIMVATGNDRLFAKFANALGKPEWPSDPRYQKNAARLANREDLMRQIDAIMVTRTKADWFARLDAAGIPCAPINTLAELAKEPQAEALGILQKEPRAGHSFVTMPVQFDGKRPPIRRPAPRIGEHNDEIKPKPRARAAAGS